MSGTADFFGLKVPFLKHLGVKAEMAEGGRSRISLELRPELLNSFEVSHVDMSLSFIRPAKGRIVAEGRLLRGGNSLHFCEGEAFDESGELVAKSLGTFKLRRETRGRAE